MDTDSDHHPGQPSEEVEKPGADDCRQAAAEDAEARPQPDDGAEGAVTQPQSGDTRRLPSIDDYDWEQEIERLARRLSPHRPMPEETAEAETDADDAEEQALRPAAAPRPRLRRARLRAAAQAPQWQEPPRRRPLGTVLAVTVPALAIATALPLTYGMPGAWTDALGGPPDGGERPVMGLIFQPAPSADADLLLRHDDGVQRVASRNPSRAAEAVTPVLLLPQQAVPSAEPAEGLALAAAQERRARQAEAPSVRQARMVTVPPDPARATPDGAEASTEPPAAAEPDPPAEATTAGPALPNDDQAASQGSPASAGTAEDAGRQPGLRSLTNSEIEELLDRGHQLLDVGDIASARLLFQLVAEAGDPRGAKAMGMTFDPSVFAELPVAGMAHDRAQAEIWYDRSDAMPALAAPFDGAAAEEGAVAVSSPGPGDDPGPRRGRGGRR